MSGPIDGTRVFDLTHAGVGPWATMILAAMGASVIKVDNPQEWSQRQGAGPQYGGLAVIYMACQLGKRGIFLDLKSPEGLGQARRLLKDADVFVENMKWGTVQRLGLGYDEVHELNPRIVYANCPGFGSTGPYRDRGSGDPTQQPFSGAASITGPRNGEPENIRWYALHDFNASSYIATTVLLGLLCRLRNGEGEGLRTENPQVSSSVAIQASRIAEFLATGEDLPRLGSGCTTTVPHRAFLCQDSRWLAVGVIRDAQWVGLCKAIDAADLLEDPRFVTNPGRVKNREEIEERLEAIFRDKPARWWVIQLRKRKVPVSLFYDYETIPDLEQVRANRFIVPIKYPRVGTLPFGNIPFQLSKTPVSLRPGPWPGQDTEKVIEEGWGEDGASPAKGYFGPTGPVEKGVLDGVTVVDLTQGLAGPYASLLLADAGAKVIKVEPPEGDYTRGWGPPFIGEVGAVFYHLNRNKEGVRLDLRKKGHRERLRELLNGADILIEEEGQVRMRRLGLAYQELAKKNPGLVYCTITPHGERGPLRNQPASELTLQAMSDFPNTLGVPGEEPVRMGPDMASLGTSLYVTHGILGALYHKWRTGEGQRVTVNMIGTLLHQQSSVFAGMVDPDDWSGFNADSFLKPPDTGYQAKDRRIGLSPVRKPELLQGLLHALGMEESLENPIFQRPPREIMGAAAATTDVGQEARPMWEKTFANWNARELVDLLNTFGSNSAVVNTYQDVLAHPQVAALGIFEEVTVPQLGTVRFLGSPWRLQGVEIVRPHPYAEKSRNAGEAALLARS